MCVALNYNNFSQFLISAIVGYLADIKILVARVASNHKRIGE